MPVLETLDSKPSEIYSDDEIARMAEIANKMSGAALLATIINEANPDTMIGSNDNER